MRWPLSKKPGNLEELFEKVQSSLIESRRETGVEGWLDDPVYELPTNINIKLSPNLHHSLANTDSHEQDTVNWLYRQLQKWIESEQDNFTLQDDFHIHMEWEAFVETMIVECAFISLAQKSHPHYLAEDTIATLTQDGQKVDVPAKTISFSLNNMGLQNCYLKLSGGSISLVSDRELKLLNYDGYGHTVKPMETFLLHDGDQIQFDGKSVSLSIHDPNRRRRLPPVVHLRSNNHEIWDWRKSDVTAFDGVKLSKAENDNMRVENSSDSGIELILSDGARVLLRPHKSCILGMGQLDSIITTSSEITLDYERSERKSFRQNHLVVTSEPVMNIQKLLPRKADKFQVTIRLLGFKLSAFQSENIRILLADFHIKMDLDLAILDDSPTLFLRSLDGGFKLDDYSIESGVWIPVEPTDRILLKELRFSVYRAGEDLLLMLCEPLEKKYIGRAEWEDMEIVAAENGVFIKQNDLGQLIKSLPIKTSLGPMLLEVGSCTIAHPDDEKGDPEL